MLHTESKHLSAGLTRAGKPGQGRTRSTRGAKLQNPSKEQEKAMTLYTKSAIRTYRWNKKDLEMNIYIYISAESDRF